LFQSATRGPSSALPRANEKGKIPPGTTAQTSENEPTPGGLVTHPTPPPANESGATVYRVAKARDLVDLLENLAGEKTQVRVTLEKDLELRRDELLVLHKRNVVLQADETQRKRPTIRLVYDPSWGKG